MVKLYVGNLPYSYNESSLREMFSAFSSVASASVIVDRDSGRSKGFGFVEFNDDSEAQAAIAEFNGKDVEGRNLVVNEARPMKDKPRGDFGGNRGGFGRDRR